MQSHTKEVGGKLISKTFIIQLLQQGACTTKLITSSMFWYPIYGELDSKLPSLITWQLLQEMERANWIRMNPSMRWEVNPEIFVEGE